MADRTKKGRPQPGDYMASFIEQLQRKQELFVQRRADPFVMRVEPIVRGIEAISTNVLLDLIGLPKTSGNGRRIARTMRSLDFVPIKSRRLAPGGFRDTVTRGWTRPVRTTPKSDPTKRGEPVGGLPPSNDIQVKIEGADNDRNISG